MTTNSAETGRYLDLTLAQTEALAQIAFGGEPRCAPKTIKALLDRGLIHRLPDKILGRDVFGPITIPQYEMPIAEHYAFCVWCSERCEPDDEGAEPMTLVEL